MLAAEATKTKLPRLRRVGMTELKVSELGFGTAFLAGLFQQVTDAEARSTLAAALASGISYFDTAPQYGLGRAEHLTGDAIRERRGEVVLSSKAGKLLAPYRGTELDRDPWIRPYPFEIEYNYSYDAIWRSYEDSLNRLGLASIDILYLHDIGPDCHGAERSARHWRDFVGGGYCALRELKEQGLVKAIGMGVNEWQILVRALELGDWDVFLLAGRYSLLEQTALSPLMTMCLQRGTSIVVGGPFNGGALLGTGMWNYAKAPPEVLTRVARLEAFCTSYNVPIGAAALQFVLRHPAVCSTIPGPMSQQELEDIVKWWRTPIKEDFWTALKADGLIDPQSY